MFTLNKLLLCLDHEPTDDDAQTLRNVCEFAANHDATVTVARVVTPVSRFMDFFSTDTSAEEMEELLKADRQQELEAFVSSARVDDVECDVTVLTGKPEVEFIKEVLRGDYDLLIKASKTSAMISSLEKALIRNCPCPVWLLNSPDALHFKTLLAAIDIEDHDDTHASLNQKIIEVSKVMMTGSNVANIPLHVVAAWDLWMDQPLRRRAGDFEVESWLAAKADKSRRDLEEFLASNDVEKTVAKAHLVRGIAAHVVEDVIDTEKIDLLVMGTVSRTGISGFLLGNTAETILSRVSCNILAVKPDGFQCPVSLT